MAAADDTCNNLELINLLSSFITLYNSVRKMTSYPTPIYAKTFTPSTQIA